MDFPINKDSFYEFMKINAGHFCLNPIPSGESSAFTHSGALGIMGPISEIYFSMDLNSDGFIQPTEVQAFFNLLDVNGSGKIRRNEFIRATDATLMEVCLESAKLKKGADCIDNGCIQDNFDNFRRLQASVQQ